MSTKARSLGRRFFQTDNRCPFLLLRVLQTLREWLAEEHKSRKGTDIDLSDWEDYWDPVRLRFPRDTANARQGERSTARSSSTFLLTMHRTSRYKAMQTTAESSRYASPLSGLVSSWRTELS